MHQDHMHSSHEACTVWGKQNSSDCESDKAQTAKFRYSGASKFVLINGVHISGVEVYTWNAFHAKLPLKHGVYISAVRVSKVSTVY